MHRIIAFNPMYKLCIDLHNNNDVRMYCIVLHCNKRAIHKQTLSNSHLNTNVHIPFIALSVIDVLHYDIREVTDWMT